MDARRDGSPLPPYDMASFTLADHMGVESFPLREKITVKLEKLTAPPKLAGKIAGTGAAGWLLTPAWNDSFRAVNRVLKNGGTVYRLPNPPQPWAPGTFWIPATGPTSSTSVQALATEFGLPFTAVAAAPAGPMSQLKPLRVALYRRYAGGNMDEGWTRFIFDQWEFPYSRVDADEIKKGGLNAKYDAVLIADDTVRAIVGASGGPSRQRHPLPRVASGRIHQSAGKRGRGCVEGVRTEWRLTRAVGSCDGSRDRAIWRPGQESDRRPL